MDKTSDPREKQRQELIARAAHALSTQDPGTKHEVLTDVTAFLGGFSFDPETNQVQSDVAK